MSKIYTSATKLVFILTAITVCVGFFMDKIDAQTFIPLATLVFSFYYSKGRETVDNGASNLG